MKLKSLVEMPIPADWDKSKFDSRNSFASQIKHAKEKAKQLGVGSSRVAFEIPYGGRTVVLKIAKNRKGLAQNEHEAEKFGDHYLQSLGVTIPMIDYDEENTQPSWICTERASKAKNSDFIKTCGLNLEQFITGIRLMSGNDQPYDDKERQWLDNELQELFENNKLFYGMVKLVGDYELPINDFYRLANWGIYNGQPVIIDLGLSNDIIKAHYS